MMKFLLSPNGRTSRGGYWAFIGGAILVSIVASVADQVLGTYDTATQSGLFETIIGILLIWPSIAVAIRRFHDRNMTGWWYLILTIAMVIAGVAGGIVGIVMSGADLTAFDSMSELEMMQTLWPAFIGVLLVALYWFWIQLVLPGDRGENKYGPDPLEK